MTALRLVLLLVACIVFGRAQAQTAAQVVPGFLTTTGCPSASLTPCFVPYSATNPIPVGPPPGAIVTGNATGTTGAVVGTLAAAAAKTTSICEFAVSAIGGTAAVGPITVAGLAGGSRVYELASSASGVSLVQSFSPCLPASAVNTAITITTTADGTATAVAVNSSGTQQ